MIKIPNRLRQIIETTGLSQKAVAEKLGVTPTHITNLLQGKREASDQLSKLIDALWPETGKGEMLKEGGEISGGALAEGYVQLPRYEISASAGGGALVQSEQVVDYLAFKADWLKVSLGLSPTHAAVISVIGDSMEPYLADGDLILVDTGVERIENDAVYVLQFGGSLLVKRVQVKLDGTVIVKSDNERYEPEIFRGEAAERLRVVGRLVRRLVR